MYNASTIKTELFGSTPLIGWRQSKNINDLNLDADIITSTSGRFFQDAHAYLTLDNIFAIAPKFEDFVYGTWVSSTNYVAGNIVLRTAVNYRAKTGTVAVPNNGNDPASDTTNWEVYTADNAKSDWLTEKTQAYILAVLDDFMDTKKWTKMAKSIIESRPLFDGSQNESEVTVSTNQVAGFEFKVARQMGVIVKIHKIGFQFVNAGTFDVLLFHSSQSAAVQTQEVVITTANTMQFVDVNWELPYLSSYDAGGTWRVEYLQSEAGNSINKAKDWSYLPDTRQGYNYNSWKLWSPQLDVHPFIVPVADRANAAKRVYQYTDNFGMNPIVSVNCDYTDLFTLQKSAFQNAILKGVAIRFLREIAINPNARINHNESTRNLTKDDILYEIDGNPQGRVTGLGAEYQNALKGIIIDTEGLDKLCLPCSRKKLRLKST